MQVERHPAILESDLPEIYASIARDDPAAAERVLNAIADTLRQISIQPECGVLYPARNAGMKSIRMFPVIGFNNYLVFYHVETEAVRILYVVHGARHLPRLFKKDRRE